MALRQIMFRLAESRLLLRWIIRFSERTGLAARFVAGESVAEALESAAALNRKGIQATVDLLGENVRVEEEAEYATDVYLQLLDRIHEGSVQCNISIKLTQLGLDLGFDFCRYNLQRILRRAVERRNFVRIDMEGSAYTQTTLDLFHKAFDEFGPCVGPVIQAYLYRSGADILRLIEKGCNVRLCKGAYKEDAEIAFPRKRDVDRNYIRLMEMLLKSGAFTAIASHDETILSYARDFIRREKIERDRFEFQMLFGVRREAQEQLAHQGYGMRVYIPFGRAWAPYFIRRLAERPANFLFVLRSLWRK